MTDEKLGYTQMLHEMSNKCRDHALSIGAGLTLSTVGHYLALAAAQCYAIQIARTALHGGPPVEKGEEMIVKVFAEQLKAIRQRAHDTVVAEEARRAGPKS